MHLCVLRGSQNKERLFLCTALTYRFYNRDRESFLRGTDCVFKSDRYSFAPKGLTRTTVLKDLSLLMVNVANVLAKFKPKLSLCRKEGGGWAVHSGKCCHGYLKWHFHCIANGHFLRSLRFILFIFLWCSLLNLPLSNLVSRPVLQSRMEKR